MRHNSMCFCLSLIKCHSGTLMALLQSVLLKTANYKAFPKRHQIMKRTIRHRSFYKKSQRAKLLQKKSLIYLNGNMNIQDLPPAAE